MTQETLTGGEIRALKPKKKDKDKKQPTDNTDKQQSQDKTKTVDVNAEANKQSQQSQQQPQDSTGKENPPTEDDKKKQKRDDLDKYENEPEVQPDTTVDLVEPLDPNDKEIRADKDKKDEGKKDQPEEQTEDVDEQSQDDTEDSASDNSQDSSEDTEQQAQDQSPQLNSQGSLSGYAITFSQPSEDLGGFKEVIDPQALDGVDLSNVMLLANHDYSEPLASVKGGTLQLTVDETGLYFTAQLDPEVSYAQDVLHNVQNGTQASASFRFDVLDGDLGEEWLTASDGSVIRNVKQLKALYEVSIVTIPAYQTSQVTAGAQRSYERYLQQTQQGDSRNMTQIIGKDNNSKAFENYIRTRGQVRDGLSSQNGAPLIPNEILDVLELKQSKMDLAKYVTVKTVGTKDGHFPIATDMSNNPLMTKKELDEIGDVTDDLFIDVPFSVETRAGKIELSNELIEDAKVNVVGEVKKQLQAMVTATNNKGILDLLKSDAFTKKDAQGFDDLKDAFNVDLEPALDKKWIMNQSAFNQLDKVKDDRGDYVLTPSPADPSKWQMLGGEVVVVPNRLLADNENGSHPIFVGDFTQAVAEFKRNEVTAQWDKFDFYSQGLSVVLRSDYEVVDKRSAVQLNLAEPKQPAKK